MIKEIINMIRFEEDIILSKYDKYRIVKPSVPGSYWRISCWKDGKRVIKAERIHKIITEIVLGPTPTDQRYEVHHIDGDIENNYLNNLVRLSITEHNRTKDISKGLKSQWKDPKIRNKRLKQLENMRKYENKRRKGMKCSEEMKIKISEKMKEVWRKRKGDSHVR